MHVLEQQIAVTTTAMRRPELLYQTYESFRRGTGLDFTKMKLFINIDPAPSNGSAIDTLDVAHHFFGPVVSNLPAVPNFAAAVKWLWSTVDTPFVFHLEDDWIMKRPVPMHELLAALKNDPQVLQARFRGYHVGNVLRRISLGPGLTRGEVCRRIGPRLRTDRNPETQLRDLSVFGIHPQRKTIAATVPARTRAVKDIGRAWAKAHGVTRPSHKEKFVAWLQ